MIKTPILLMALAALGCATKPKPAALAMPPQPPLPRSSIAAILQQRGELGLTDEQVRRLQELDDQLDRQQAAIRQEVARREEQAGQARGEGRRGGRAGGSWSGRGSRGGARGTPNDSARPKSPEERMDDNDTKAYLEAEKVLIEAQLARAREIASHFREELWNQRQALRQ